MPSPLEQELHLYNSVYAGYGVGVSTTAMPRVRYAGPYGVSSGSTRCDICVKNVSMITFLFHWVSRLFAWNPYGVEYDNPNR